MSLILLTILFFLLENVFHVFLQKKSNKIFFNKVYDKLKKFTLFADVLFLCALSAKILLSRFEPLLVYLLVNAEELITVDGAKAFIKALGSHIIIDPMPVDLSVILVVFLAYFGGAIVPGVLYAFSVPIESPLFSSHRDIHKSGIEKYPEIHSGEKLFIKLSHLLN